VRIAGEVCARIEQGWWKVGDVLPTEVALAEEFGVSRPTMREALSALQFAGYVESRRRRGTVVLSAFPVPGVARHVTAAASFTEVADLLEARLAVEPVVLALAAADPDPAALDGAQDVLAGMALVVDARTITADTDHRLHVLIARVCRNPLLRDEIVTLLDRASGPVWRRTQDAAWQQGATLCREWVDDHAGILAALERGDGATAAAISRRHLLSAVENAANCAEMPASVRQRVRRLAERSLTGRGPADPGSAP
jgi:DNA-binding FadR family transcriptional regulator